MLSEQEIGDMEWERGEKGAVDKSAMDKGL